MLHRSLFATLAWACAMLIGAQPAQASLVLLSDGAEVLDTQTNLVWTYDWSLNGEKTWQQQMDWAKTVTLGGVAAGSWAVASTAQYVQLWADGGGTFSSVQAHFATFKHVDHWTSTGYAPEPQLAEDFNTALGRSAFFAAKSNTYDVALVRVFDAPEPQTLSLVLLALLGLVTLPGRRVNAASLQGLARLVLPRARPR